MSEEQRPQRPRRGGDAQAPSAESPPEPFFEEEPAAIPQRPQHGQHTQESPVDERLAGGNLPPGSVDPESMTCARCGRKYGTFTVDPYTGRAIHHPACVNSGVQSLEHARPRQFPTGASADSSPPSD